MSYGLKSAYEQGQNKFGKSVRLLVLL